MKTRDKNPVLSELIAQLHAKGRLEKVPFWQTLAKKLNRPNRLGYEVNLFKLQRHAQAKHTVVVPGKVLGTGELTKPLEIAALKFSGRAEEKIKRAGGRAMSIEHFVEHAKSVKGVTIMG